MLTWVVYKLMSEAIKKPTMEARQQDNLKILRGRGESMVHPLVSPGIKPSFFSLRRFQIMASILVGKFHPLYWAFIIRCQSVSGEKKKGKQIYICVSNRQLLTICHIKVVAKTNNRIICDLRTILSIGPTLMQTMQHVYQELGQWALNSQL